MNRRDNLSSLLLLQPLFPLTFTSSSRLALAYEETKKNDTVLQAGQTILQQLEQQQQKQQHQNEKGDDHQDDAPIFITLPLERCSGGTNCVRVTISYDPIVSRFDASLLYVPTKVFKLAVDTGSPYLVISDGFEFASYVAEEQVKEVDRGEDVDNNKMNDKYNQNNAVAPPELYMWIKQFAFLFLEPEMKFQLGQDSGYPPTVDIYGSQSGTITWKKSLVSATSIYPTTANPNHILSPTNLVFGILDENLAQESGGPLFGLIKNCSSSMGTSSPKVQLRPTLLQQLSMDSGGDGASGRNVGGGGGGISSFSIDSPNRLLTLCTKSLIGTTGVEGRLDDHVMPLVDLRFYGDFVDHYAVQVVALDFGNGKVIDSHDIAKRMGTTRPIVAVLDTGLTGCLMSDNLWQLLFEENNGKQESHVKELSVRVKTLSKDTSFLFHAKYSPSENPFFSLGPISLDWFDDEDTCPFVIVLGQSFLNQGKLTIDIDDRRALFSIGK